MFKDNEWDTKIILKNNKYVFLYDINITNYTVTGTDRHNEKWVFPKSEIKEICVKKENENGEIH